MFKEKVKAQEAIKKVLDENCKQCNVGFITEVENGKSVMPDCSKCHKHDPLAAQIAEIKE